MINILDDSCSYNESFSKKKVKDFLLTNLKRNCEEFESLVEDIDIEEDLELKEKINNISNKCHELSIISLNILGEEIEEIMFEDIESCAMGLSEIRNWIKSCIKNKALKSELNDISNFFDGLEEIADRMKFIDSIQQKSLDSQKTFIEAVKKRRDKMEE